MFTLQRKKKKSLFGFTIFKYGFQSLSLVVGVWKTCHVVCFCLFALFVSFGSKHLDTIERSVVRVGWTHVQRPVRSLFSQPPLSYRNKPVLQTLTEYLFDSSCLFRRKLYTKPYMS